MKKIYIIIFLGLVFRLYHIDFPVLGWHSWRQSDTAAIAKNLYENGFNVLYPQINWNANGTGYVESEFHIYPLIVSILYSVFGVNDMFGRIVSLLFSLLTIYGIYILVRKILNEDIAVWSSFIYAILPLNIFYGRAFMPEAAMLMCSLYSVYFFNEWLEKEKIKYFLFAGFFTCFAVLIKLPALYLGLPLLYLSYIKYGIKTIRNLKLWLFVIIVLLPVTLWYYHAHQIYLNNGVTFGIWSFGSSKWGMFGQLLDPLFYHKIFMMDLAERHFTYPGFILLLMGLFVKRKYPKELLFDSWLIAVLIYFFIVSEGNMVHEYYQLPFVLPAVIFIGKILNELFPLVNFKNYFRTNKLKSSFAMLCLVLILLLSYIRVANFMKSENWDSPVLKMANDVKGNSGKSDFIVTVSNGDPVYLYLCERKGWTVTPESMNENYLNLRIQQGAKWLAAEKNKFKSDESLKNLKYITEKYQVAINKDEYYIFKLTK